MSNRYYTENPKGMFCRQKASANRRGIDWQLSYEDWKAIWDESGKLDQRGRGANKFCLARKFDEGPYSVDNVYITENSKNSLLSYKRNIKEINNPTKSVVSEYPDNYPWHHDLGWKHPTPLPAYGSGVYSD